MNKQEIFDTVLKHARDQNKKSKVCQNTSYTYLYRHPDGLKCFAGCLIPDELYDAKMEQKQWHMVLREFENLPEYLYLDDNLSLVRKLQRIHDFYEPTDWEERFKQLAEVEGLVYDSIEETIEKYIKESLRVCIDKNITV